MVDDKDIEEPDESVRMDDQMQSEFGAIPFQIEPEGGPSEPGDDFDDNGEPFTAEYDDVFDNIDKIDDERAEDY